MAQRSIDEMSAQELYELARQREQEEAERQREAQKARLEELREQRKQLVAEHKKTLSDIDREIQQLSGSGKGRATGTSRARGDQSKTLLDIIEKHGPISTKALKEKLEEKGIDTKNLNQQLNYLKRRGAIATPERAVYTIAG